MSESTVWLVPPTYRPQNAVVSGEGRPHCGVLALIVRGGLPGVEALSQVLPREWHYLWTPRIIVLDMDESATFFGSLVPFLTAFGIDSVMALSELNEQSVRRAVTLTWNLGGLVVSRLQLHGIQLRGGSALTLQLLFDGRSLPKPAKALAAGGVTLRSAERWLAASRIPGPRGWFQLAKCLYAVLALQQNRRLRLEEATIKGNYAEPSALSHACRRLFGLTPKEAGAEVGWEPLVEVFLRTHSSS